MKNIIITIFVSLLSVVLLAATVKGAKSPTYYQYNKDTSVGGPYEASNTTARYALTEAIVEKNTFFFDDGLTRFAAPDVVEYKGNFFSIFTPGVSFIGVPFYILGKSFGYPQLVSYLVISIFAFFNIFLVARLAQRFGASWIAGLFGGFVFLFGTNALVYAHSFTQHHISTAIILIALLNALSPRTFLNNLFFGMVYGIGVLVDIPNPIILFPVGLYAFFKNFSISELSEKYKISIKLGVIGLVIGVAPFLGILGWYNYQTSGSYTLLAQSIGRAEIFRGQLPPERAVETPEEEEEAKLPTKSKLPFNSRKQLQSLYILFYSNERSWLFYSPIVLLGIVGLVHLYRKSHINEEIGLAITLILTNGVLYSLFGDPWGGWAFGSRYLIPSAALLSSFLAVALYRYHRNLLFIVLTFAVLAYSAWVNVLGSLTTSMIPPRVEAIHLPVPIPYTYQYNLDRFKIGEVNSYLYNFVIMREIPTVQYFLALLISILGMSGLLIVFTYLSKKHD